MTSYTIYIRQEHALLFDAMCIIIDACAAYVTITLDATNTHPELDGGTDSTA